MDAAAQQCSRPLYSDNRDTDGSRTLWWPLKWPEQPMPPYTTKSSRTETQRTSAASCSSDKSVRPLCSEDVGADDGCRCRVAGRAAAGADFAAAGRALMGPRLQIETGNVVFAAAPGSACLMVSREGGCRGQMMGKCCSLARQAGCRGSGANMHDGRLPIKTNKHTEAFHQVQCRRTDCRCCRSLLGNFRSSAAGHMHSNMDGLMRFMHW